MFHRTAFLAGALAVAALLVGCGSEAVEGPASGAPPTPRVGATSYVASPTLGVGDKAPERLFAISGLGRFSALCKGRGRAKISYKVAAGSATQLVTTEGPRESTSNRWLDPGQHTSVAIGPDTGPRTDWQVALLSKGTVEVATGSFTVARLNSPSLCFVTGKANLTTSRR